MRRTLLIWLAPVFVLVAVAMLFVTAWRHGTAPSFTLPDGTRVKLLTVLRGGESFTTEKAWHRLARQILPARWQSRIPGRSAFTPGDTNSLCVVLVVLDEKGTPLPVGSNPPPLPWGETEAVDDTGFRYGRTHGYGTFDSTYCNLTLREFPRRQRSFDLVFQDDKDREAGRLRVKNPLTGPFLEWRPEPLPITRTNGPVRLTLRGLRAAGGGNRGGYQWIEATADVASDNSLWKQARAGSWTFEDATGNRGQWLSPREPAWKALTTVQRQRPEDFLPAERGVVPAMAVPGPGEFAALDFQTNLAGVLIRVLALAGPGTLRVTNDLWLGMTADRPGRFGGNWSNQSDGTTSVETALSNEPFFLVQATGLTDEDEVAFRFVGDDGWTDWQPHAFGWIGNGTGRKYSVKMKPPPDVRHVGLEVYVNHGRKFEFLVNPAEVKPQKTGPR